MPSDGRQLGPNSRPHVLAKLDRRTREARLMEETRSRLIKHLGGTPTPVEAAIVDRCALLTLYVAIFDRRTLETGRGLSDRDARQYLAYSNALARHLRLLGLKSAPPPAPSLRDYLAEKDASEKGAAA